MRRLLLAASATAALLAGPMLATRADAAPAAPAGIGAAADTLNVVDSVQFIWGGRRHCWYPDGWHGPGWYWCGYGARVGFGWGGPAGWHGWVYRGRGRVIVRGGQGHRVIVHRKSGGGAGKGGGGKGGGGKGGGGKKH